MEILGNRHFWIIAGAYIFTVVVYLAVTATIVPYARTFGVSGLQASRLVMVMGLASIVGKLGFAAWTDRIGLRNTLWVATALNLASVILLASVQGYGVLFVASACTGASAGGILPVWPGLVAERFGRFNLPRAMGLMSPIVVSLQGFGAPIVTALHFRPAFAWFIGVLLLSGLLGLGLSKPAPSSVAVKSDSPAEVLAS
jgi:MFS family permease